jgi:hypothetical protein
MLDVRYLAGIGLFALVPVALFLLDRSETFVAFALVNVVIISSSVYLMFSGGADHDDPHPPASEV